jgi:hypothetical protein
MGRLPSLKATDAMADRAHAAVARHHRVQAAQSVNLAAAHAPRSSEALAGCAIEHQNHRTMVIVMLGAEVEQRLDGAGRDATLL